MVMPHNLQRLPPEALSLLRYMQHKDAVSVAEMEAETELSNRAVGRAIRRLVNFDLIELTAGRYQLTTDGKITVRQLVDYEQTLLNQAPNQGDNTNPPVIRRLTAVLPRTMVKDIAADVYVGVNPPNAGDVRLPHPTQIDLRVSVIGGTISTTNFTLNIPPNVAAYPARFKLTPDDLQAGRQLRLRIDAFHNVDVHEAVPLGGMYVDIKVVLHGDSSANRDQTMRAVGMDLVLRI